MASLIPPCPSTENPTPRHPTQNPCYLLFLLPSNQLLGEGNLEMSDMAASLRRQLNGDLLLAMKAKDIIAVSALRSVLSALDNASAVPVGTVAAPVFGRNGDVPRRDLSDTDCQSIISAEVSARVLAAEEYARLGRADVAARLRAEQAVVERYVRSSVPNNVMQQTCEDARD